MNHFDVVQNLNSKNKHKKIISYNWYFVDFFDKNKQKYIY